MKLSFIVPVYNTEPWLAGCLDSLLLPEAAGEYEIVAVNDGSTDSSAEILRAYEHRNPELLRVISTPNGGLGHARNTALEKAGGEFLVFVDSDDRLAPGAVREMLRLIHNGEEQEDGFDVLLFDLVHVDERGRELCTVPGLDEKTAAMLPNQNGYTGKSTARLSPAFSLTDVPPLLFSPHNAVNKIWRAELFRNTGIRFPDRLWFEDLATVPKLYLHAQTIRYIPQPWYLYLQRQGSIMLSGSNVSRNSEMTQVADGILGYYQQQGCYDRFSAELEYKFFYEEYLSALIRVSLGDPDSPVQTTLRDDYLKRFPHYRENRYIRSAPVKYRILDHMIRAGQWRKIRAMMSLNHQLKNRKGRSQ